MVSWFKVGFRGMRDGHLVKGDSGCVRDTNKV